MKSRWFGAAMIAACSAALLPPAIAPHAVAAEAMRPEVGRPLAKARQYLAAHNYSAAMAQVRIAANARGLTPEESFVVEQMRGSIAETSGDMATAARTFAEMLKSGRVSGEQRVKLLRAEIDITYRAANYPAAIDWLNQYFKAGGNEPEMRQLQIEAYYQAKDYANAARLQQAQINAILRARQKPTEAQLDLLAACQRETGDATGFQNTMVQLVTYYPKPDYWANLIHAAQTARNFSDRFSLDIFRFQIAVGQTLSASQYMEATELALQVPLPGLAKEIIDKGYADGVLGSGPQAAREKRLQDLVNKTYASELPQLAGREADAQSNHDGNPLAALGEEYVSYGQVPKGVALIQAALRKDQLRHPEDTKLHLGLAYYKEGQKAQALQVLKSVGGTDGGPDVARLWILLINHG
jgi:hypothetical protein